MGKALGAAVYRLHLSTAYGTVIAYIPRRITTGLSVLILESVKKLEELFIAPTARQILHETAQRAFARCECA